MQTIASFKLKIERSKKRSESKIKRVSKLIYYNEEMTDQSFPYKNWFIKCLLAYPLAMNVNKF